MKNLNIFTYIRQECMIQNVCKKILVRFKEKYLISWEKNLLKYNNSTLCSIIVKYKIILPGMFR